VRFRDLESGEILDDEIPNTNGNLTWAEDNRTLFYTRRDLETLRTGPSYMVDTLREIRTASGDVDLFLILGVDQYAEFDSWHDAEVIPTLAHVAVLDRGGESLTGDIVGDRVIRVPVTRIDISSTDVRARVRDGRDVSDVVPPTVASIIEAERLYRG
jgi:nicotinate-nucleotide adenylyltransferase